MNEAAATDQAHARLQAILKAVIVGRDVLDQASVEAGEAAGVFQLAGALEPPYDPETLCLLVEHSHALRQNLDAYAVNIDGFGHRFEPAIDFEAEDAERRVADAIFLERVAAQERGEFAEGVSLQPTDDEVAARKQDLVHLARIERARLQAFFDFCCFDQSFVDLRRRTRQDLETTGNTYWEVLRDGRGQLARLVYVPSHTVRLMPLDAQPIEVVDRVQVSPVSFDLVPARRRLRRFVQVQGNEQVFFKAFADPRVLSKRSGKVFPSVEALRRADPDDGPATELLHFAIQSPRSPYGVPRWVGALLAVLGSRQMEEVNYLYFENKSVPPLALLISGGRLSESSVPRIERFIEENLKGKANFHKILILEAEGGSHTSDAARARIELRPLTDAQQQDALFQQYDERNIDKVGSSFRLPRLLRGDSRDFNRAVADAQLRFAEDQVFQPERDEFDHVLNKRLLGDLGIRFWRFRSQTPVTRDPERMTDMVEKLVRVGVLTPEEGRQLASDIFNREFATLTADWVKRPITLTLAGIQTGSGETPSKPPEETLVDETKRRMALAREAFERPDPPRIVVPAGEWGQWFTDGGRVAEGPR